MRNLLFLISFTLVSCLENAESNNPSKELYRTFGESGVNYSEGIEYEFVDSLTLTGYSISLPLGINCDLINSTQSLLDCFPELYDVAKEIEKLSESHQKDMVKIDEYTWLEENYSEVVYSPDRFHFYFFEMFTDVIDVDGKEQQIIKYSVHPKGGTATLYSGTLPVKR